MILLWLPKSGLPIKDGKLKWYSREGWPRTIEKEEKVLTDVQSIVSSPTVSISKKDFDLAQELLHVKLNPLSS